MKITVLTDNHAGTKTRAEHGLSLLVEYDGKKILFDTGQSDLFLRNADEMQINLADIDLIVLSHGHFDHGNGLDYLKGGSLLCHPSVFARRFRKKDHTSIGLHSTRMELEQKFNLATSSSPYRISEKIWFLGEIPRTSDFESKMTDFILEDGSADPVPDDSAIAVILPDGLFVITGCGHAGIVNTLEHARKTTGADQLSGIIGGFHLKTRGRQLRETINYLKTNEIKHVHPCHCTELPAMVSFFEAFHINQVRSGDVLEY